MDIRLFKFINGQEVVAEVRASMSETFTVRNPLVVHMMRGQDGAPTLGFAEWSVILKEDQDITIYRNALACDALEIMPEVAHSYEQQMSSLILPPEPSGKILLG
jgi:hypothetical protein